MITGDTPKNATQLAETNSEKVARLLGGPAAGEFTSDDREGGSDKVIAGP